MAFRIGKRAFSIPAMSEAMVGVGGAVVGLELGV